MTKSLQYFSALLLALFSVSASALFTVTPTTVNFGGAGVGSSFAVIKVTFSNINTSSAISFSSISATGNFSIAHDCPTFPALLHELTKCTIDVTFLPLSSGALSGTLTIAGDDHSIILDAGFLPFTTTASLSGTGLIGDLFIDSNGVDLGSVPLGTTSSPIPVILSNPGNAAVNISAIATMAPFTQTNDCPDNLAAAGSCNIMVSVAPESLGTLSGSLTASGIGPQGKTSQSVSLSTTAVGAALFSSFASLSFPDTPVNTTSSPQSLSIRNQGNRSLQTLSVSTTGDFTQTNDCPAALNPNLSCTISITASPSTQGDLTGSVQINGTSAGLAVVHTVPLSVLATVGELAISDRELTFAKLGVNVSSNPQPVTISNQGSTPLQINSITTEGDFTQTNDCGVEIDAGGSCTAQIVFAPQSSGPQTGALNIDTSSGMSTIVLSGTGEASPDNPVAGLLRPYTGDNPNVISTSEVIGEACPSGRISARMQEDCNVVLEAAINGDSSTRTALFQITPESATKANKTTRQGGETQTRNIGSRITALRAGARGLSFRGLDLQIDDQNLPIKMLVQSYKDGSRHGGVTSADNPLLASRLGVFITGDIATGSKDETDLESGLDFDTYGITIGADYRITNQFILGGAVGYIDTNAELENNGSDLDTQGISLSLYGTYYSEQNFFVDFSATYGSNDFDQKRYIVYQLAGLADINQELKADYDGDMASLFIGSGYDFNQGVLTFGPRADLEYVKSDVDGFTEEISDPSAPGGGWATRISATDQRWLTLNLGGKISYTHSVDWGVLIPYARLDWLHEFKDDSQIITAHFVSDPAANAIQIETDNPDRDYLQLRFGTSAQFQNGVVGFINFGSILAHSDWNAHTISAGLRMEF
ncbi:MAG: autotransporter domain-containing protein [Candidatus Thiodiazotropha sp. (ex Lucinoma aequizonata)]|nr:autotransporter domain-containing protein [Candidatus Thiodiazotropha sp. (ex Lucinoma aequizonata)]MCU7888838.1 autotransporter domain-containing protein [Candidatus Thiodiazotropha sp. (ex Lucinoma aequizonata)]MCU7896485.1 autotransporter domain-containing protein [Candidatus Thiodiazotropha sp. (ex Lucinoma aequizonata)]MCU7900366.1 autotransporter domain-containing protein [Candidatus Thiodiazotropha sp. (ex Lucinoma aequizonata)]MCU7903358.1 autotransporter domain-containing protein [C